MNRRADYFLFKSPVKRDANGRLAWPESALSKRMDLLFPKKLMRWVYDIPVSAEYPNGGGHALFYDDNVPDEAGFEILFILVDPDGPDGEMYWVERDHNDRINAAIDVTRNDANLGGASL
jgi:hypothetical protein